MLVPKKGLEPPHPCGYMDLNHARLPIPPLRRGKRTRVRPNSLRRQRLERLIVQAVRELRQARLTGRRIYITVTTGSLLAVFLQLVVQRLEADAQNLCGTSLVVMRAFQRLEDQQALALAHGRPDSQMDRVGVVNRGADKGLAEAGRKVLWFDHG